MWKSDNIRESSFCIFGYVTQVARAITVVVARRSGSGQKKEVRLDRLSDDRTCIDGNGCEYSTHMTIAVRAS